MSARRRSLALPYGLTLLAVAFALLIPLAHALSTQLLGADAAIYAQMASDPTRFTASPWGYRMLTPWLVHLSPLPSPVAFFLLTVGGCAGAAVALGLFCVTSGLSRRAGLAAAILFLCSFACTFTLHDFRLVDPLAYLGTSLLLLCLARCWWLPAALCVPLTTLDKEWGVLLIPVLLAYLLARRREVGHRLPRALLLGVVAPLAAYVAVRHWPGFGDRAYGTFYTPSFIRECLAANIQWLPADVAIAFGAIPVAALIGWERAPRDVRLCAVLLAPALLQIAFATDGPRMIAFAFPTVCTLAAAALEGMPPPRWALALACLALSALLPTAPIVAGTPLLPLPNAAQTGSALALLALAVLLARLWPTTRMASRRREAG